MLQRRALLFLLLLTLAGGVAFAEQLMGIGGPYWGNRLAATTTTQCVRTTTSAGAACELFPAGDTSAPSQSYAYAKVAFSAGARCAWSLAPSVTITGMGCVNGASQGPCALISGASGTVHWTRPAHEDLIGTVATQPGICTTALPATANQEPLYMPCTTTPGCGSFGTCATTQCGFFGQTGCITRDMQQRVGAYLVCVADSTANVDTVKERVRR